MELYCVCSTLAALPTTESLAHSPCSCHRCNGTTSDVERVKNNRPLCSGANPKLLFGTWLLRSKEGNHFSALICPPVSVLVITYAPWQRRHGRGLNAVRGWPRKKLKGFPEMEKFHYHRLLGLHWFQIFRSVRGVLLPVVPNNRSESVVLFPALAPHAIEFK